MKLSHIVVASSTLIVVILCCLSTTTAAPDTTNNAVAKGHECLTEAPQRPEKRQKEDHHNKQQLTHLLKGITSKPPTSPFEQLTRQDIVNLLCGRHDDWCKAGSPQPILQCCPGYRCRCHLLTSVCRCRKALFGRS